MERVTEIIPAGHWQRTSAADVVCLAFDDRLRRRKRYTARGGAEFLLDLPELTLLADGDGLKLSSGAVIAVEAEAEDLLEVACPDPVQMARIAWHLGNRHVAVEMAPGYLRLRAEPVIAALLDHLGAVAKPLRAPFNPEGGAFTHHHGHGPKHEGAH